MSVRDILKKHQLFKELSDETLSFIEREAKVVGFELDEVIISIGHPGKYFGIVVEGQLEARGMRGEKLGIINQAEYLGEMSLLTGEPSIADVLSVSTSRVLLIPNTVMSRILPESPHMLQQLSSTMRARLMKRESSMEEKEALHRAWGSLPGPADLLSSAGAAAVKILVISSGSTSLKWNFYDLLSPNLVFRGRLERLGLTGTVHMIETGPRGTVKLERQLHKADHAAALKDVLNFLTGSRGTLSTLQQIDAVGHRVLHGGEKFTSPLVIDDDVLKEIRALCSLAPQHNSGNLKGIEAALKLLADTPQVAVFDTAFHQTIPPYAYLYGIPGKFYRERGVRRYGFYGTSHHYAALEAAAFLKRPLDELKIITCHLGNEASICAVDHGRSIDTSMGLTPSEGLVMGSRCGDIDAGVLIHLARQYDLGLDELDNLLNTGSGLLGLSGISNHMREINEAAAAGSRDALMAVQVFCYRVKKYIGAYTAALGGLDLLVFTGDIGIGAAGIRARVCQGLFHLGVILDEIKNRSIESPETIEDISDPAAGVKILVVPKEEEKMIARETIRALQQKEVLEITAMPANRQKDIPIRVSYRHVHLNEQSRDTLFGTGFKLTSDERLSQTGQIVYKERVNLVGPKGKLENVRIQGPLRNETQVEIARTEEFLLGVDAPVRESGNLSGTPGITIEGPNGRVVLKQGVINAQRHIQMDPEDALLLGLRDGDRVMVTVGGERSLIFVDVVVRVSPYHKLEMHVDSDDAHAAGIEAEMTGRITGIVGRRAG